MPGGPSAQLVVVLNGAHSKGWTGTDVKMVLGLQDTPPVSGLGGGGRVRLT